MSQPVLLKIYAALWPASQAFAALVREAGLSGLPADPDINLAGSLLTLSFEGLYFPVDELLAIVEKNIFTDLKGKIDVLDIENWQLRRYLVENRAITLHEAPLNNVLDYSGH